MNEKEYSELANKLIVSILDIFPDNVKRNPVIIHNLDRLCCLGFRLNDSYLQIQVILSFQFLERFHKALGSGNEDQFISSLRDVLQKQYEKFLSELESDFPEAGNRWLVYDTFNIKVDHNSELMS